MESFNPTLSIVIPAFNEEKRILPTLNSYYNHFTVINPKRSLEIIVILNGCTDLTLDVVKKFAIGRSGVHWIEYPERLGKGGAIIEGLKNSGGDQIAIIDADNMIVPEETAKLIDQLNDHDICIGWRKSRSNGQPLTRKFASCLVRKWTKWILRLPFHDTQCGAKVITKECIMQLLPYLTETGWILDIQILLIAIYLNKQIKEIELKWEHKKENSKLNLSTGAYELLISTIRLQMMRSKYKKLLINK
jgi:glycosyltransferase involved in cell wall biosynthesis